jgi:hypothetical protein
MSRYGMIKRFVGVWIFYWFIYFCQPVHSIYQNVWGAFALQFLFVILTLAFFAFGASTVSSLAKRPSDLSFDTDEALFVIRSGIVISFIGLSFLLFDKIYIQGIDYSQGLAIARQEWRILGEERAGAASSVYSAIGYLFGGAYFISLSLSISKLTIISDKTRLLYIILCLLLLLLNSAITGGRSSILLAMLFAVFGYFTRSSSSQKGLFFNRKYKRYASVIMVFVGGYVVYIFNLRATASEQMVGAYSLQFLEYLGFVPSDSFARIAYETSWGGTAALINLTISYLTHSFATTAAIVDSNSNYGDAIFVSFMTIGSKFGILPAPVDWFLSGRFSSLPGAVYFQYGLFGLASWSAMLGMLAGRFAHIFSVTRGNILVFFLCSVFELILLMSPFLFAAEFLFFPSVLIGSFLTIFVARILRSRRLVATNPNPQARMHRIR